MKSEQPRKASDADVERAAEVILGASYPIALTGAGISVPSGIPDFRSPGTGLWANVDPMAVAHIDAFRHDPKRFWSFYGERFQTLEHKRPNRAHEVLAELVRGTLDEWTSEARRRGISLHVRLPIGPLPLNGDPIRLTQALGKRGRIHGASPTSHLVEAEWVFQQGLDDQEIPLLLEQQNGRDDARTWTASIRVLI